MNISSSPILMIKNCLYVRWWFLKLMVALNFFLLSMKLLTIREIIVANLFIDHKAILTFKIPTESINQPITCSFWLLHQKMGRYLWKKSSNGRVGNNIVFPVKICRSYLIIHRSVPVSFRDEILLLVIPENAARCPLLRHGVHGGAGEADPRGQVTRPAAGPATVQGLLLHQQALHHHRTAQLTIGDVVPPPQKDLSRDKTWKSEEGNCTIVTYNIFLENPHINLYVQPAEIIKEYFSFCCVLKNVQKWLL